MNFFNIGIADDGKLLFLNRLAVGVADELALGFILDFRLVFFGDHVARSLARTEARQRRLLLDVLRDGVKRRVHGGGVQFHPQQFFARGQIFNRYVHSKIKG